MSSVWILKRRGGVRVDRLCRWFASPVEGLLCRLRESGRSSVSRWGVSVEEEGGGGQGPRRGGGQFGRAQTLNRSVTCPLLCPP